MSKRRKISLRVRMMLYGMAALMVPGGMPYGLVDHDPGATGDSTPS